jgi:ribosomal protein L13
VSLSWTGSSDALSYDIQILESPLFTVVKQMNVTTTSAVVIGLKANTKHYAKVSSRNLGGTSDPIQVEFTTLPAPPAIPASLTATVTATSATLSWGSVPAILNYVVEVHDKQSYNSLVKSATVTTNSSTVTGLESDKLYYWCVKSVGVGGESDWARGEFKTALGAVRPNPPAVTLVKNSSSATFTFGSVTGATLYEVKLYDKANNGALQGSGSTNDASKPVVISGLKSKEKYYYEATVTVGTQTSEPTKGDFTTDEASTTVPPPELSVAKSSSSATFTFKAVTGATLYEVKLYDKANNGALQGSGSTNDASKPVVISGLKSKEKYYYEATVTIGTQTSEPTKGDFTTDEGSSSVPPPEVSVAKSSSSATFTFKAVTGATSYDVKLYDKANNGTLQGRGSTTSAATPVTITGLKSKEKYYYEATVTVGTQTSEPTKGDFTTDEANTSVRPPEVTVAQTASSASFAFKLVTGATLYEVRLFDKQNTKNASPIAYASTRDAAIPATFSNLKSREKYYYEATVTVGTQTSEPTNGDFTTAEPSTSVRPPEVSVQNTATTAALTFKPVTGATSYDVKLYDKQNTAHTTPIDQGSTSDPARPVIFANLASKQKYYYEATVTVGTQTSEPTKGDFTTDEVPASDVVLAPTGLLVSNLTESTATVSWTGVGQGVRFEIEVSPGAIRDANAQSPYRLTSLTPGTEYTWSVKASKGSGQSEWVAGPSFTTPGTPPPPPAEAPTPPADLQVSALTPTSAVLSWTGNVQGARFELQISPSGVSEPNASAPYTAVSLIPSTRYTWHVRTTKGNVSSAWIEGPSFTTPDRPISAVEKIEGEIPQQLLLSQNYPNPFNPSTNIEFSLPAASDVRLSIYNTLGNEIQRLVDGRYQAGRYLVTWDAAQFPSGVYFYRLQTQRSVETKRLILVK